jgi:predicted nuclease with TOPRIM domain
MSYGNDVTDKTVSDRGLFERAAMYIPGYRGYRDKNIRREVDKEVRREVVRSISGCKSDLANIQRMIIQQGSMDLAKEADRIRVKTDTYLKKIESAESGYSGLWEGVKTLEDELNAVVEWDAKLLEGSAALRDKTNRLMEDLDNGKIDVKADLKAIERFIDGLVDGLNERAKVIKGLKE